MLDVDHIVAHLQIAEVRKKRRHLRLRSLRTRRHQVRLVKQVARPKNRQMRFRQNKTVGKVSLQQRRSQHIAGKVRSLVSIAFPAARAAAQAIGSVVLGEHIGEALNFSRIRHGQNHLRAAAHHLLHFLDHRGHRAMKARRRLRKERCFRLPLARQSQILEVRPRQRRRLFPPTLRRQVKIRRTNQVPDLAPFVRLFNARPNFVQFQRQRFGLIQNHPRVGKQPENAAVGARHRSVKLPPRKNSRARVAHRLLHRFRRSRNAFPRKPRIDRTQQFFGDGSLRQRQQQRLIHRVRRPLARRIELPHRLDLIAEKFDPHRAIRFRRVHIENAAPRRILPWHFHHIGRAIADCVQMLQQFFEIESFTPPQDARQVRIVFGRSKQNGRRRHRRNHNRRPPGGDLPQRRGAFFLNFRMRRQILKGKHITRR